MKKIAYYGLLIPVEFLVIKSIPVVCSVLLNDTVF